MDTSFLAIAIVAGLVLLVIGSMSIYEGLRDSDKKTTVNNGLLVMGVITIIVSAILYFYMPIYSKKEGANLLTMYTAVFVVLAGFSLGTIGIMGATETNEKPKLDVALKTVGGISTATGLAGVIIGSYLIYTKLSH